VKEGDEEVISDYTITKAKMTLDTATADGVRNITASVTKLENGEWLPAAEVEMRIGVRRHGGILSVNDEQTFTTDSTGTATAELSKEKLPGDLHGNYIITARIEDNDQFGTLEINKTVPWGVATKADNSFFSKRTLWTTRFRTPWWLLFMAYPIIIGVWGTLIYLVFQLIKIRRLGTTKVERGSQKLKVKSKKVEPSAV
jgi:hypothetical protein